MSLEEDYQKLEEYRESNNRQAEANALLRIGVALVKKSKNDEALEALQECYDICRALHNDLGRLEVTRKVVPLLVDMDRIDEAEAGIGAGMDLAEKLSSIPAKVDFLDLSSQIHWKKNQPQEAVEALITAADICRDNGDNIGRAVLLEKAAPMLRAAGRFKEGLTVYEILTELTYQADDKGRLAMAIAGQGQMLKELGLFNQSLAALDKALELFEVIGHAKYIELVKQEINAVKSAMEGE